MTHISDDDLHLFNEGTHYRLYEKLGAHLDANGVRFAVWAPDALAVYLMGDFNHWHRTRHPLAQRGQSGIWETYLPGIGAGAQYKYRVVSHHGGYAVEKADPFAFHTEKPPLKASVVWSLDYEWGDTAWMAERGPRFAADAPVSIYEVHLGSWRRVPEEGNRFLTYREIAPRLADYAIEMGYTHVELLPVMEHPFYGSWGYQITGFFAPTSRYGTPQDFMYLIDHLHQRGIGVILDWVPSHFPSDEHGLGYFDGSHLYEHADVRQGFHPDWKSLIFNYGRNEVANFLISNAQFWLEQYHADGLRVDAVASMLYLDYSRTHGEWVANEYGGRENLPAIRMIRTLNEELARNYPTAKTIAEESTWWPMASRPTYLGGLGFDMKWDLGWMHDTLKYLQDDPILRKFHHQALTFRPFYAFTENFVLPLSHDEVVHGKGSLINKMSGDWWQKFANLRLLFAWMYAQPGKKLTFMGCEFGQIAEWNHDASLDWHLLDHPMHAGIRNWIGDLNRVYRSEPSLHQLDFDPAGFSWVDWSDADNSVVSMLRRGRSSDDQMLAIFNFTPIARMNYMVGAPVGGTWHEVLNSDAPIYGGTGHGNMGSVETTPISIHGQVRALTLTLPPLGAIFLKPG